MESLIKRDDHYHHSSILWSVDVAVEGYRLVPRPHPQAGSGHETRRYRELKMRGELAIADWVGTLVSAYIVTDYYCLAFGSLPRPRATHTHTHTRHNDITFGKKMSPNIPPHSSAGSKLRWSFST